MISGDVADPDFCREAVDRTTRQLGRLDVLVNNAAFQEHVNDFEDLTEAHFDRTIKTTLYGYFHMAKAAVPQMKPGSAIVMTGSVTGLLGNKNLLSRLRPSSSQPLSGRARDVQIGVKLPLPSVPSHVANTTP